MTGEELGKVLVVEDHARTREMLCEFVQSLGAECCACEGYPEAIEVLEEFKPDVVVLDYGLGEHSGREVLLELRRRPAFPVVVVVSGQARGTDAFELAQLGARVFVAKPITPEALRQAIEQATRATPDLVPILRSAVGHIPIHQAQQLLRETMVTTALEKAHGNRSGAARVLQVSRQLLQHMIRGIADQPGRMPLGDTMRHS